MYDCHDWLNTFHDEHVRLGQTAKQQLAKYRDLNLERLNEGLDKLGQEKGTRYAHPIRHCNQGSYAMHTMIQNPEKDYDLDVAIIFRQADLPGSALATRQRIAAAFKTLELPFAKPPEARTNAVTIWYAEGYHLDFAVYREMTDTAGKKSVEHAGPEWLPRDPMEITDWFKQQVSGRSPAGKYGAKVAAGQLRRIVRWLKALAKVQETPQPGGLIISVLAANHYAPHAERDDIALYYTMRMIHTYLGIDSHVYNPVDSTLELTSRDKDINQVKNFRQALGTAISNLQVLFQADCDEATARAAWQAVFQHDFWRAKAIATEARSLYKGYIKARLQETLSIKAEIVDPETGQYISNYPDNGAALPKGTSLRFSVAHTSVPQPYQLRWIVRNCEREAEENDDLGPRLDGGGSFQIEHTGYTGMHTMSCEIVKEKVVLAEARYRVNVK